MLYVSKGRLGRRLNRSGAARLMCNWSCGVIYRRRTVPAASHAITSSTQGLTELRTARAALSA